jgi:uncharacterized protein (DUF1778 family)
VEDAPKKTKAQIEAQKRYMEKYCEIKVRVTVDEREDIKSHAEAMGESTTKFINRAIQETMKRDKN